MLQFIPGASVERPICNHEVMNSTLSIYTVEHSLIQDTQHVLLSPSSTTWYQPKSSYALQSEG